MITNVSCNGASDGKLCIKNLSVPTLNGFINIVNTGTGLPIPGLATPDVSPAGSVITAAPPDGVSFTLNGQYCWYGLPAGKYEITVKDSSLTPCLITSTFEIEEPDTLALDYEIILGDCSDTKAQLQATADGGTGTYTFTLENLALAYGPISKTTGLFKNVIPDPTNQYTLTVVDENGCTESISFLVETANSLSISVGTHNISCFDACDGIIEAVAVGGTAPYRFILVSEPEGTFARTSGCDTGETCDVAYNFRDLCAGSYKIKVIDANGCTFTYPNTITLTQPTKIEFDPLVITHVTCNNCCDGSIEIPGITGGTPFYSVELTQIPEGQITPSTIFTDGLTPSIFSGLKPGNYEITITDDKGCTRIIKVGINSPASIQIVI